MFVKQYLLNFARVPRFSTVVLFMSSDERLLVKDVWSSAGDGGGLNISEKKAWGIS